MLLKFGKKHSEECAYLPNLPSKSLSIEVGYIRSRRKFSTKRRITMPQFIRLSKVSLNVNTIKGIIATPSKPQGERGCIVYFIDGRDPHLFYGSDADKLFTLVDENQMQDSDCNQIAVAH